jgi:iron complex outermembrane receptor protein
MRILSLPRPVPAHFSNLDSVIVYDNLHLTPRKADWRNPVIRWMPALSLALLSTAAVAQEPAPEPRVVTVPVEVEDADKDDPNAVHFEEVIVTSQKRAKSQRDIPGSVGAIRGADLEKMHAQGMKDYLKLVPGVIYVDQGNEESGIIIRGISSGFDEATQGKTGVYMEDMPFADLFGSASFPDLNPFDLERVEVLKGPQGTLFGSGALAGAVRYIVQKPQFGQWEAKLSGTATKVSESDSIWPTGAAAINIPVGDTLAFRAVGVYRRDRGVYDMGADDCTPALPVTLPVAIPSTLPIPVDLRQIGLPFSLNGTQSCNGRARNDIDADRLNQFSARALAAWKPFERFNVSAFYFAQKSHHDDSGLADQAEQPKSDVAPFASPRDHDFGGGNLLLTYDSDWFRVLSSTNRMTKHNYYADHAEFGFRLGQQNDIEYVVISRDDVNGWTQELRLSSPEGGDGIFEWLIGASYLHFGNATMFYSYLGPDMPDPKGREDVSQADIVRAQVYSTADQLATEKALFGEITARLGDHWEVTLGARRYQTALEADTVLCGAQNFAFSQNLCTPEPITDEASGLNPKFSIRYIHNKHVQWYALAAKGFQFGGIQVNPAYVGFSESAEASGFNFAPYESSELWNYESGIRTEWLNRRLRFDVTAFYLDWSGLQLTVTVPYLVTNLNFTVIANVGRAHSTGLEFSFEALPFSGAKWITNLALINAVTDVELEITDGTIPPGARLPGTPKIHIANVFSYEWRTPFFGLSLGPTLTHAYIGKSPDSIDAKGTVGGYTTYDAQLVIAKRDSRFVPELSIGVNNLTDERGVAYHLQVNDVVTAEPTDFYHFIQPRTIVANVSFRF